MSNEFENVRRFSLMSSHEGYVEVANGGFVLYSDHAAALESSRQAGAEEMRLKIVCEAKTWAARYDKFAEDHETNGDKARLLHQFADAIQSSNLTLPKKGV